MPNTTVIATAKKYSNLIRCMSNTPYMCEKAGRRCATCEYNEEDLRARMRAEGSLVMLSEAADAIKALIEEVSFAETAPSAEAGTVSVHVIPREVRETIASLAENAEGTAAADDDAPTTTEPDGEADNLDEEVEAEETAATAATDEEQDAQESDESGEADDDVADETKSGAQNKEAADNEA